MFARTGEDELTEGVARLCDDIDSERWHERHRDLLAIDSLDLGYRLVISDL